MSDSSTAAYGSSVSPSDLKENLENTDLLPQEKFSKNEESKLQHNGSGRPDGLEYGSIPLVIEFDSSSASSSSSDQNSLYHAHHHMTAPDCERCRLFSPSALRSLTVALLLLAFFSSHQTLTNEEPPPPAASTASASFHQMKPHHWTYDEKTELLGEAKKKKHHTKKHHNNMFAGDQEEWKIPHYFHDQLVDHFTPADTRTWKNRYYVSTKYWNGPGAPIFVIMGGEGPADGVFYKFVMNDLAQRFGAFVLQTEHRFYGTTFPHAKAPSSAEMNKYLSPDQALEDYVRIIQHMQGKLHCSTDKASTHYCPIITVGASYPGFLSAMMRFVYPHVVDMAYASSAPIRLYSREETHQYLYFDHVTKVADAASPGCAAATKETLTDVYQAVSAMPSVQHAAKALGICHHHMPKYISTPAILAKELTMMTGFSFADFNMEYYPPGDTSTDLLQACQAFQQQQQGDSKKRTKPKKTALERFAGYLVVKAAAVEHPRAECYDLHWDIPDGPNATITGSDWTGMGDGYVGNAWEFQCCRDLIVNAGFSPQSMFLDQPFDDVGWLTEHCQSRFGVAPQPYRMVHNWKFDDMVAGDGGSYILFTNGLNDAWSVFSHTQSMSKTLVALNFPSGAHHSELNSVAKGQREADDILEGREQIAAILEGWINIVKQLRQKG